MGWLRCAGLHRGQTAYRQSEARRGRHGCAPRHCSFHHAAGWYGLAVCAELAQEKGIKNLDWCRISSPRTQVRAKALVTRRMRPFTIDGKVVHQVGMPWHWGYEGLSTGDIVNELTSLVADPNVSMHEG